MFFAGNTSKRGFSTRKCKESARMASLRTSPAAVRALVSGARSALASGAPQSSGRDSRARGIGLRTAVVALAILGVAVVGALPAAVQAKALASASMSIVDFVWWNVTENRAVTLSTSTGTNADVLVEVDRGSDRMDTSANLSLNGTPASGTDPTVGRRKIEDGMQSLLNWSPNQPPTCAPVGSASCAASPEFAPINPPNGPGPYPAADYARSDADYEDFFASVFGSSSLSEATAGLRAEVSLATQPPAGGASSTGSASAFWDTGIIFTALRDFDSYFSITAQSQALARLDDALGSTKAVTVFDLLITRRGGGVPLEFLPSELNLDEETRNSGLNDDGAYSLWTTSTPMFTLVPGALPAGQYTLSLFASVTAEASLEAAEVAAPPTLLLLLTGISGILAFRGMPSRHMCRRSGRSIC
jgi:hypothetical protein